jgi:uncharacterized radical SAM superfamily protein
VGKSDLAGLEVADTISFDVVGSERVARSVYGLDLTPAYFESILTAFDDAGLNVVPHVTAGLDRGKGSGEERALEMIARHNFRLLHGNFPKKAARSPSG